MGFFWWPEFVTSLKTVEAEPIELALVWSNSERVLGATTCAS